jgi:thymidylate synthase (FAD)
MRKIETCVLNPEAVKEAEKMMVCAARLTQKGHSVKNLADFMALYEKGYNDEAAGRMINLPHPTLQKFSVVNVVVVGASRRFLAQITRHQNEVKYMSASLQYSDYSDDADFVVPYELIDKPELASLYLDNCKRSMEAYRAVVNSGLSGDSAGYAAPQGLRNILIISATPFQWKHMICQRICRRNTAETRYVMLLIWERLYALNPLLFSPETTAMFCMKDKCLEGAMSCGTAVKKGISPSQIIETDFPLI